VTPASGPTRVEVLLAEWVLERLPPERLPDIAVAALEQGCDAPTLAVIVDLRNPARADVEDHLPRLLRDIDLRRPSRDEALKTLVDDAARRIVAGETDPLAGASYIWSLWGYSRQPDGGSAMWADFRPFVGLASECEEPGPHVTTYKADIVDEAKALLQRGGLRIET
jgi:hypothetical protein